MTWERWLLHAEPEPEDPADPNDSTLLVNILGNDPEADPEAVRQWVMDTITRPEKSD